MRQTAIGSAAVLAAIVAIWGGTVLSGYAAKHGIAASAGPGISVMQMMKDAKNLPDQQFDAY